MELPNFEITVVQRETIVVLVVTGEIDMQTAPHITESIAHAATAEPVAILVDLSNVDFLASAGMTALLTAHNDLAPHTRLGVVAAGPATARPMRLLGVDQTVLIYPTLDAALADLRIRQP